MAKSPHLTRNDFVKTMVGVLGATMGVVVGLPAIGYLVGPFLKVASSDVWRPLGPLDSYPVVEPTPFSFTRTKINGWERSTNSYGVYIVRQNETETRVFSNVCTHLSCRVTWREEQQEYFCPCHDGIFTAAGAVAGGPPPRPMDEYASKVEDGTLFFNFLEG